MTALAPGAYVFKVIKTRHEIDERPGSRPLNYRIITVEILHREAHLPQVSGPVDLILYDDPPTCAQWWTSVFEPIMHTPWCGRIVEPDRLLRTTIRAL